MRLPFLSGRRCLSVHFQDTRRINDELLIRLTPYLTNLTHLYLVGCPKLTHEGVWSVISSSTRGIRGLGLEALSTAFDMEDLSQKCSKSNALRQLRSITLTGPSQDVASTWARQVVDLLSLSPLEMFHVSTVGGEVGGVLNDDLCESIVLQHGRNLRRFSVDRMGISTIAIANICKGCPRLEQLFITAEQDNIDSLGSCLSHTRTLRSLHIKRPVGSGSDTAPVVPQSQILRLANQCGSELQQIGCNTRVWQVRRDVRRAEDGSLSIERCLVSYELPEIPEQFLVVRS
ncbi:hypothetical protein QCA50_014166 [Cerrena zonata]|uniref:RNI-like protein n=1 Tax=Cerrena zonata TaxID=2478898 RepID=A0AAW0FZQ4_9APHY